MRKQRHKWDCEIVSRHRVEILEVDEASMFPPKVNFDTFALTFQEMDELLRRWIKYHSFLLMATAIHALELPRDSTRSKTHTLWLKLTHRQNTLDSPGKHFRIAHANVVAISEVALLGKDQEWKDILGLLSRMRDRSKIAGTGDVAVVVVECPPLGLQILPVGSLMEHYVADKHTFPDWRKRLIQYVERGEKIVQFGA